MRQPGRWPRPGAPGAGRGLAGAALRQRHAASREASDGRPDLCCVAIAPPLRRCRGGGARRHRAAPPQPARRDLRGRAAAAPGRHRRGGVHRQARPRGRPRAGAGGRRSGLHDALETTGPNQWYLSLERMRRIERIDAESRLAVVQAGVVLQTLQDEAAAQGAAVRGGPRRTRLGHGLRRHQRRRRARCASMMREQVLGLEVVTADGEVLDLMAEVLKNNAGYDLKQLPHRQRRDARHRHPRRAAPAQRLRSHDAAWLALPDLARLPALLARLERGLGGTPGLRS
ncbi:MAG: FAD-binding protein [Rubrivivax sp.]